MMRAWEVTLHRKACLNAGQSARRFVATVRAASAADAMKAAEKLIGMAPFKAMSARPAA